MKPFRLYECCPDGTLVDIDRLIMCDETREHNYVGGAIVKAVFDIYGFTQYAGYYSVVSYSSGEIGILYNSVKTWLLRIEPENEGENQ